MRDELSISVPLSELASHHLDVNMGGHLNKQTKDGFNHTWLEEERYAEMLRKGTNVIQTQLKSLPKESDSIPDEQLFTMNDSHGLAPDMAITLARQAGWSMVNLRTGFSAEMAERHARMAKEAAKGPDDSSHTLLAGDLPPTVPLYYDTVYEPTFEASVLACLANDGQGPTGSTHAVVLDSTLFYPEGGGQEGDHGRFVQGDLHVNVLDTQK